MAGDTYRYLLRIPEHLRARLAESATREGRSFNAELNDRLERSFGMESPPRPRRRGLVPILKGRNMHISNKHLRLAFGLLVLVALSATAILFAVAKTGSTSARGTGVFARNSEEPVALSHKFDRETFRSDYKSEGENPNSAGDEAFDALAYPYGDVTASQLNAARSTFLSIKSKGVGNGRNSQTSWYPMGPTNAQMPAILWYHGSQYTTAGRTTALALAPGCSANNCRLYIAAAGGGVWRTDNGLSGSPNWTFVSGSFDMNSVGSLTLDPTDSTGNTLYAGTGEFNACGSGCVAGVGIYKTTDGGNSWTKLAGSAQFKNRGVGSIAIDPTNPQIIYAGIGRALRGASSVCCDGAVTIVPGAAQWGLYKSTDGGATFTFIHNGAATTAECGTNLVAQATLLTPCSPRGVRQVVIDPNDSTGNTIYAASYARGIWRSPDGGTTWTRIYTPVTTASVSENSAFDIVTMGNGDTRMYVGDGVSGTPTSRFFRSDSVRTGSPSFTGLTSSNRADTGYGSFNFCTGQCWYDNYVTAVPGHPDMVYLGGSFTYAEVGGVSNARGVVLSQDAGVSWTDMTEDAQSPSNGLHPDQHALVLNPSNPLQFFEASDGGVMRSDGTLTDTSSRCDSRPLGSVSMPRCKQLLSAVPTTLTSLNKGLNTLQFQSLSVNPANIKNVMGGTQDNGTYQTYGSSVVWPEIIFGDGGLSGFDATDPNFRVHTYTSTSPEVSFNSGDPTSWIFTGDPIESGQFYSPLTTDPNVHLTMFMGAQSVWRTKTGGVGPDPVAANLHCNELFGDFPSTFTCGDWVPLGAAALTSGAFGTKAGLNVSNVVRAKGDNATLWAGTSTGRLFISKNADAEPASSVNFVRLDNDNTPHRFVSGLSVSQTNPNVAYVSFSGFSHCGCNAVVETPAGAGHVFKVTFDPSAGGATWENLSYNLDSGSYDEPVTGIALDDNTGDLYASTDFGVLRLASGSNEWNLAANGMPHIEVAGLTIVPSKRKLFAASHGQGAWSLTLP